jgi:hypothetical protein
MARVSGGKVGLGGVWVHPWSWLVVARCEDVANGFIDYLAHA